jgi:hypothetical protein
MSNQPGVELDRVHVERGIYRRASGRYTVCVMIDGKPRLRTVTATTIAGSARATRTGRRGGAARRAASVPAADVRRGRGTLAATV